MIKHFNELSLENQVNYNELLVYLMNYALEHEIGIDWTHKLPAYAPPVSYDKPKKLIIMNAEWENIVEIPFQLAHEIGHIFCEYSDYFHLNKITNYKGEAVANIFAIQLLQQYCLENEFYYSNCYTFAKAFGIPKKLFYLLEEIE